MAILWYFWVLVPWSDFPSVQGFYSHPWSQVDEENQDGRALLPGAWPADRGICRDLLCICTGLHSVYIWFQAVLKRLYPTLENNFPLVCVCDVMYDVPYFPPVRWSVHPFVTFSTHPPMCVCPFVHLSVRHVFDPRQKKACVAC